MILLIVSLNFHFLKTPILIRVDSSQHYNTFHWYLKIYLSGDPAGFAFIRPPSLCGFCYFHDCGWELSVPFSSFSRLFSLVLIPLVVAEQERVDGGGRSASNLSLNRGHCHHTLTPTPPLVTGARLNPHTAAAGAGSSLKESKHIPVTQQRSAQDRLGTNFKSVLKN